MPRREGIIDYATARREAMNLSAQDRWDALPVFGPHVTLDPNQKERGQTGRRRPSSERETYEREVVDPDGCVHCGGMGYVKLLFPVGHPYFGTLCRCPDCGGKGR